MKPGSSRSSGLLPTRPGDQPLMPRNVSRHPSAIPALGSGWIAYAYWTNNSGHRSQVSLQPVLSRLLRPRIMIRRFSCSMASRTPADNSDGRLETFLEAMNGSVWNIRQTIPHSGPWSQVNSLGGIVRAPVCVAPNSDGRLEILGPDRRAGPEPPTGAATASASGPGRRCGLPTRLTTRVARPRPRF